VKSRRIAVEVATRRGGVSSQKGNSVSIRESPRPLVVGQAPSRTAGRERAFDGASGRRLAKIAGIDFSEFFEVFETVNLLRRWPGKHGGRYPYREKGDRFPLGAAKRAARRIARDLERRPRPAVVICGSKVAEAFGLAARFFDWQQVGGTPALVIPHPSGCNLLWNVKENRDAGRIELGGIVRFCERA
jgi:uracil-DNA glycosylase